VRHFFDYGDATAFAYIRYPRPLQWRWPQIQLDEASSVGLGMVDFLEIAAAERSRVGDRAWRLYFFFGI
jgi:hypothetical protein